MSAGIKPRGASLGLTRAVVDFAADVPFGQVEAKVREHYKILRPKSFAAREAGRHAKSVSPSMALPRKRGGAPAVLVDMFHVCKYLSAAAPTCRPGDPSGWVAEAKERLMEGKPNLVLSMLFHFRELVQLALAKADAPPTPVADCHRYLAARLDPLNYPAAVAAGLPIGSGEIESAHRHVMQARLKRPGAWWTRDGAQAMLNLRVMRANGKWEDYWAEQKDDGKGCALPKAA